MAVKPKTQKAKPAATALAGDQNAPSPEVEELASANEAFREANNSLHAELVEMKATMAKNNPVIISQHHEAMEEQIGQDGIARFDGEELLRAEHKTLDDPAFKSKMDALAFDQELVTVDIHETAENQGDPGFQISVAGRAETFFRGQQKTVKRMYVEGLARAKKTGYANQLVVDPVTGEKEYVYPAKSGLRYSFAVVDDPNPKGREWLKAILRQP